MKNSIFDYELSFIKNPDIKNFTIKALESLPDYFYEVAASSSGKYHPQYALGQGGLVRHTKAAVRIALELFRCETVTGHYSDNTKDIIISALLLHDGCKHGLNNSKYTITEHPIVVVEMIRNNNDLNNLLDKEIFDKIMNGILTHMGQWTSDYKTGKEVLEKPKTGIQNFIHMCDYLASRKSIEINFEVGVSL